MAEWRILVISCDEHLALSIKKMTMQAYPQVLQMALDDTQGTSMDRLTFEN